MEKLLAPIRKDVVTMKGDITQLKENQSSLEVRVAALETGGQVEFKPTYLEVRGFCDFASSTSDGISRAEATVLVNKLKAGLDPSLQQHVRELQLQKSKNYKIRVPVTPDYLQEIRNVWNE